MHALLAMAASHLRYLQPHVRQYHWLGLCHMSLALRGFREALSAAITAETTNGLISCALLLLHNSWGSVGFRSNDIDDALPLRVDELFPLAAGLHRLVMEARPLRDASFFGAMVGYGPVTSVTQYAAQTGMVSQLELFLAGAYRGLRSSAVVVAPEDDAAFMSAAKKLAPALVILKLNLAGHDTVGIRSDAARYLFSWPAKSEDALRKLIYSNYDAAQILLLYYYTAVSRILPEKLWWARERSRFFCDLILRQLRGKSEDGLQWAANLHEAAEKANQDLV